MPWGNAWRKRHTLCKAKRSVRWSCFQQLRGIIETDKSANERCQIWSFARQNNEASAAANAWQIAGMRTRGFSSLCHAISALDNDSIHQAESENSPRSGTLGNRKNTFDFWTTFNRRFAFLHGLLSTNHSSKTSSQRTCIRISPKIRYPHGCAIIMLSVSSWLLFRHRDGFHRPYTESRWSECLSLGWQVGQSYAQSRSLRRLNVFGAKKWR